MKKPKNLLIQYKGGGYDGCFWEWNYFLFDSKGTFHDIASSGYRGITTKEDALELLKRKPDAIPYDRDYYLYNLNKRADRTEFVTELAPQHIFGVCKAVNEIYNAPKLLWKCDACENEFDASEEYSGSMHHTGYHGNGGIGVEMEGQLCVDCYCSGTCGYCGEYYGQNYDPIDGWANLPELVFELAEKHNIPIPRLGHIAERIDANSGPYCQYCMESEIEKELKDSSN